MTSSCSTPITPMRSLSSEHPEFFRSSKPSSRPRVSWCRTLSAVYGATASCFLDPENPADRSSLRPTFSGG
jgi:hypothetical protein